MFWTISAILFVLWVLGMVSGAALGLWIHLLLVFALVTTVAAVAGGAEPRLRTRRVR